MAGVALRRMPNIRVDDCVTHDHLNRVGEILADSGRLTERIVNELQRTSNPGSPMRCMAITSERVVVGVIFWTTIQRSARNGALNRISEAIWLSPESERQFGRFILRVLEAKARGL